MAKKKTTKKKIAKKRSKKSTGPIEVSSVKHAEKRKNIPTEQLRNFVKDDDSKKTTLYPRNPDLDPQLVWRGKDEQDAVPLEVPDVPIYIQEKIHPQAIIEDFRKDADRDPSNDNDDFGGLFADFNGLPEDFADRIDFYRHDANWSNRLILGDSQLVMNSLAEKEGLKGHVQMVYFDPPYGIKFGSNWQVSTKRRDVKDGKADHASRQPEQVKAFRDTWSDGIHTYLAYLRDRLLTAHELLSDSGSVFVQIGDENVHLVRSVLDEVFGSENVVSEITFKKTSSASSELLAGVTDYILWYAKDRSRLKYRQPYLLKSIGGDGGGQYRSVDVEGHRRPLTKSEKLDPTQITGRVFRYDNLTSQRPSQGADVRAFEFRGRSVTPGRGTFKTDLCGLQRLAKSARFDVLGKTPCYVRYLEDFPVFPVSNLWDDTVTSGFSDEKRYVVQTLTRVVERCMLMCTDPGDLVLDPTCGSGTTAYVAEQWGRRWITNDTSRVALTLARTRLMAGRFPYYHLADQWPQISTALGDKDIKQTLKHEKPEMPENKADIRKGFVYERVPHVTLKSIANNEEIDAIYEGWQDKSEPLREKINNAAKQKWEEWELPRLPGDDLNEEAAADAWKTLAKQNIADGSNAADLLAVWWDGWRARQREIDESIANRADQELLYDRPYEDKKRVRVTGPFTVESLSPHRTISVEDKSKLSTQGDQANDGSVHTMKVIGPDDFGRMVLENLQKSGVQNTYKDERLKFDTLEAYAGEWIQGSGEYTNKAGKVKKVAVCIGPEHGTVGSLLIKEAAKEAVKGIGFEILLIAGFAFDATVTEEAKQYGNLTVLPVRMNNDLAMGELLKKTGAGNLFTVFGEPDVTVRAPKAEEMGTRSGKPEEYVVIEVKGIDVYDPTTGEVRSGVAVDPESGKEIHDSRDDVACWFLDTDYNGESFFVRHAYFTGADDPYAKLKRAMRAEIDEEAWELVSSTTSRPFPKPESGKIAVKVINHYGDEVMQVYAVPGA
jgi:adenine-specific DNA-methyltransferase